MDCMLGSALQAPLREPARGGTQFVDQLRQFYAYAKPTPSIGNYLFINGVRFRPRAPIKTYIVTNTAVPLTFIAKLSDKHQVDNRVVDHL